MVRTLEELIRIGIRPLKLGGLSKDAIAQMLDGLSPRRVPDSLVSAIFEESQGYPFFVEEVDRHLVEDGRVFDAAGEFRTDIKIDEVDVPENVRLIISRRLERLGENEKQALAAAAVIGRSFSFQLLAAISRIDVDELFTIMEKAQQMGIIVPSSKGPEQPFIFAHELVRQTLLAGISVARKQRLHARVADAIELVYSGAVNERAGEIADHILKAGSFADRQRLVRWLTLAGKSALEAAAFKEARRRFESALSHEDAVDPRERAQLLANLAKAAQGLDLWDMVVANLHEALQIYINLGDREMIGRGFTELTDALIWAGRFQEATETARRGLNYFQAELSANRARLLATLAQRFAAVARYESAQEALQEALGIASQLSEPKLLARLLGARAMINYVFLRLRETAADGEKSGESDTPPWERAIQLRVLYQTELFLGRLEEASKIRDELEPLATKIGESYSIARCLITRAWMDFGRVANLAKLETAVQQALTSNIKMLFVDWEVFSEVQLSLLDFFRGNWPGALIHAQASSSPRAENFVQGFGVGTLFRQMAYAGDDRGAFAILDENRGWLPRIGQPNIMGSWLMLVLAIEGLVMLGEQLQAGQLYPLAGELLGTGAVLLWPIFRFSQTVAGIAAAAAHEWETAEDHFQTALQQAESFPYRLEQAEIRRFHAMMLMDRAAPGDREKAYELLSASFHKYDDVF